MTMDHSVNGMKSKVEGQDHVMERTLQGFIITDDDQSKEYGFRNIEDVSIKAGPAQFAQMEKINDGAATKEDPIYGVNVFQVNRVRMECHFLKRCPWTNMVFNRIT